MKKLLIILVTVFGLQFLVQAQDEPAKTETAAKKAKYTKATFRSTRIINMQSVEILPQGNLQFMISHHFGEFWNKDATTKENFAQMFGLNSGIAHTYLSLDYSATNRINVGLAAGGKSNFEGWVKVKLLRQQTGLRNIPVSVTWFSLANVNGAKGADINGLSWNRYSFLHQLLIARKFSDRISLQLTPSWIHYNIVPYGRNNSNEIFSLGIAGKYKIASNKNFTFEYTNQLNMHSNLIDKNGNILNYDRSLLALGMEFDTGGHLFQLYIGTTTHSTNIEQLTRNTSSIKDGNFALGFTINRGFNLKK